MPQAKQRNQGQECLPARGKTRAGNAANTAAADRRDTSEAPSSDAAQHAERACARRARNGWKGLALGLREHGCVKLAPPS